ncbi:hypothetical protein PHYPO_G00085390 [Pangasianodon hypophthalmus]|uniref:Uncharacterized protein n=1 Tax=Pangasianodon hypophthalmus TaxID=310915 RepID=A0A5N5LHB2_PANHP|nr:hypothetical protein PHYPO_G00085390 [Pangasianodon hypophthalmus]
MTETALKIIVPNMADIPECEYFIALLFRTQFLLSNCAISFYQELLAENPFFCNTSDKFQSVTVAVLLLLEDCSGVKLKDDEHELKELQSRLIDTLYTQVLQRTGSQNELFEALKSQSPELTGSLAVSIIRTLQSMSPDDSYVTSSLPYSSSSQESQKMPELKNLFKKLRKGKTGSSDSLDQKQHCSTDADMITTGSWRVLLSSAHCYIIKGRGS